MLAGIDRGRQLRGLLSVPCHGHEVGQPGQGRRQLGLAWGLRHLHMASSQHGHSRRMALASSCLVKQNTTGASCYFAPQYPSASGEALENSQGVV